MKRNDTPAAPKHLSGPSKRLWKAILGDFDIADAAHLRVLQAGLEALDRAESCRLQIAETGELVSDRWGQLKANPLLPVERDARAAFVNAIKSLGLDPRSL